ncbi:hypothetical protein AK812_SmicGene26794 [Symbiodinium microadriaticum]|uniref:Uncharacterized protein n=1 Tax=Symbiodinium microadriaticum TaxID=2951 RepID=A0A1Q9D8P2_SYMMI|nr:hypothetical protein AK812_SmicGene26794 [Symbiodinium microadriaticum]CAE7400042.1 unnamed protein product [Symbiodinium microadriaticum]
MQEELSADKGVFFAAVLQNMAKRMAPAASLSSEPAELLQQGVCLSRYWERFGGFAGQRDLGAIAHTLAHAMDALQAGRINQASDHLALLAVCVEQMSMDSGRAELGYQLTWLEEPPAAMFTARSSKSAMHTRAFAPLASQRWVAIVLSYIKELDVIATKRADIKKGGAPLASGSGAKDEDAEDTPSPSRPKRYAALLVLFVGRVALKQLAVELGLLRPSVYSFGLAVEGAKRPPEDLSGSLLWSLAACFTAALFEAVRDCLALSQVMSRSPVLWEQGAPTGSLTPCFRSLYQGDHMGVEFALAAHASLLKYGGALLDHTVLQNHRAFPLGDTVQALVIDDLVGISVLPAACDPRGPSPARRLHTAAGEVYQKFSVLGSPEKDVNGESLFTAIGCEIDSRKSCVRRGLVAAAAPLGRRLGLSSLSLRAARLPVTSSGLVSRLTGAWTSAFLFRRCCMVVLSEAFAVANRAAEEPRQSKRPIPLSRRLAQELVLASVFSVAACADLTAGISDRIFATDASLARGAACSCSVPTPVARALWQNGDRRGAYSRLEAGPRLLLKAAGLAPEEEDLVDDWCSPGPPKQVPFHIDVLEIGCCGGLLGGPGVKEGVDLSPLFSPAASRHYDVLAPAFAGWLCDMLHGGRVRGLLVCPPCASCGLGPALAYWKRCLGFLRLAAAFGAPCLLLLPGPACLAFGSVLERLVGSLSCEKRWIAFEKLGAQEPGGLMCVHCSFDGAALESFEGPADYGAPSFLGPGERSLLGLELLRCFSRTFLAQVTSLKKPGIESVAVNDVLSAGGWAVDMVLPWKGDSHINVLELATVVALHRQLALSHADCRITVLVDSQVAKSAAAKGRSSSRSLSFALMRSSALQLGFGLFVAYGFAPTRLNIADDPTRFAELRDPSACRLYELLPTTVWHFVSALRFRRPLASWARLFLLVVFDAPYDKHFIVSLLSGPFLEGLPGADHSRLDFDSTLGFPGEGPSLSLCPFTAPFPGPLDFCFLAGPSGRRASSHPFVCVVELFLLFCEAASSLFRLLDFDATLGFPGEGWVWFRVFFRFACAMAVVVPSTPAEHERARRRSPVLLVADRVVRPVTRTNREKLSAAFDEWLLETHGITLRSLLDAPGDVSEKVANLLVGYGQALFRGGQPYYKYSETINAVAALKPSIRRSLTYAWDLAFAWLTEEPHCHHKAMPRFLVWLGLAFYDLVRIDPADVIDLLDAVFGKLPGHVLLWPQSGATLRRRLEQIQDRLGLVEAGKPAFDMSSFRPGGATWALNATENSELVRRRGRWLSLRVMDIYLQEVVAITYLPSLEPSTRACVDSLAAQFTAILQKVIFCIARGIPRAAWYTLLRPNF